MKNILKDLVLIWLSSMALTVPVKANDSLIKSSNLPNLSRIIIIENQNFENGNKNHPDDNERYQKTTKSTSNYKDSITSSSAPTISVEKDFLDDSFMHETIQLHNTRKSKSNSNKEANVKSKYPRLKRLYFAGNIGYFYTKNNMEFTDSNNCTGLLSADFICKDTGVSRPISIDYKDEYFWSGSLGLNTTGPFRFELSYYQLGKELAIKGSNVVGVDTRNYNSNLDLRGGSANLYFDFVVHRRDPYFLFVPYVMGGLGVSEVQLGDITFIGSDDTTKYSILGNKQRNKTTILGTGFTIGLNNYISFDIGYRYYNFGRIKTLPVLQENIPSTTIEDEDIVNLYDLQLETRLKSHIATVGLRIQI